MKERPIIVSAEMVRAVLDDRKTQTRRVIKPPPTQIATDWTHDVEPGEHVIYRGWPNVLRESRGRNKRAAGELTPKQRLCPYGQPGGRLWVRETWAVHFMYDDVPPRESRSGQPGDNVWYRADGDQSPGSCGCPAQGRRGKWRPPIYMPRWASRINLEVTGVRVERVQDIGELDAKAEGVPRSVTCPGCNGDDFGCCVCDHTGRVRVGDSSVVSAKSLFQGLWDSINKKRGFGWDVNPWVWVIEFRRIKS